MCLSNAYRKLLVQARLIAHHFTFIVYSVWLNTAIFRPKNNVPLRKKLQNSHQIQSNNNTLCEHKQILTFVSSYDSSYPFRMLDIIQANLTFCTAARNKSVVLMPNQVFKFLSHEILGRPTPLLPSNFHCSMDSAISKISVHFS